MMYGCAVCIVPSLCWALGCAVCSDTPLSSVVQSTELPSLSTDRHLVYPLKASFALSRGELYAARSVPTFVVPSLCWSLDCAVYIPHFLIHKVVGV